MMPNVVDKHLHSSSSGVTNSSITSPAMSSTDSTLWKKEGALSSIMFPYVRDHADEMIARIRHEDHVAMHHVHDVCLYKRVTQTQETMTSTAVSPLRASSLSSSFSSSRRDISITRDPTESAYFPGDFEFRGITHVPGTVDMVLNCLASETARENYWVALNTLRDVKAAVLLSSARLQSQSLSKLSVTSETDRDVTAFPRWSRKYMATKFTKHNPQVLDCCYAEYATRSTETNGRGHSRLRGFVYRRSVSERALSSTSRVSSEPLAKAHVQGAARIYIRDWLFDVVETQDPHFCKLVLICTVFVPPTSGRGAILSRSDFQEFCTELMVGTRRALTHQWKDHAAHAGVRSSSAWRREARCCTVCSAQFSLLRKRYTCHSCGSSVCSKCWLKTAPGLAAPDLSRSEFGSSVVSGARTQQHGSRKRECLLCAKFGPDDDLKTNRIEHASSRSRHFSNSMASMSASISQGFAASSRAAIADLEQEEIDQVHPDLELRSTASISGSRGQRSHRSVGSISSQCSISGLDDDDEESDEDVRTFNPRLDLRDSISKLRTESAESRCSSRSAPGVVLLSDLETLTLSGSFHRATSVSARSSARLSSTLPVRSSANARMPAKSAAPTSVALREQQMQQRQYRAASVDYFLLTATKPPVGKREGPQESSASTDEDEDVYSEDDLANFTLKLLSPTQ